MANISKIKISGTSYNLKDENACNVVELTQAQYDELPTTAKTSNSLFVITDATAGDLSNYYTKTETDGLLDTKLDVTAYTPTDLSNYYTKSETSGATEISTALASKADTATTYTKTETDNAITAATSTKQDTLVSGTNIKTINGETLLGEGNIEIQGGSGGGKAIEAGRGISVTTSETADTVSFNLPISAGTGTNALIYNSTINAASGDYAHAEGEYTTANGISSHAEGYNTRASGDYSHAEGYYIITNNQSEHASGQYNVSSSASTTFGHAGNTLFSVGNGTSNSGRKNAFEIRQNGDTYLNGKLSITGDVTANAFYATSDERLKENIENVSYAKMANAANVNIKSFNFKSDEEKKTVIGVIAQDVEKENLGFIVSTSNDGMKAVDYTGLSLLKIAYLEQKVKELENTINELKENKQ